MGCGNITPANSIRIQNNTIHHEIKIQKINLINKTKTNTQLIMKNKQQTTKQSENKYLPKSRKENVESLKKYEKNKKENMKNILKKKTQSNEDISFKHRKKVKFEALEPRFSLKVQNLDKLNQELIVSKPKLFIQKQDKNCQKIVKKPRYLLNKINTQKQDVTSSFQSITRPTYFQQVDNLETSLINIKTLDLSKQFLPKIHNLKTQQSEQSSLQKNDKRTIDYKKYLKLLKQRSPVLNEVKQVKQQIIAQRSSIKKLSYRRQSRQTQPSSYCPNKQQEMKINTPASRGQKERIDMVRKMMSQQREIQKRKWQVEIQEQKRKNYNYNYFNLNNNKNRNGWVQKIIYF